MNDEIYVAFGKSMDDWCKNGLMGPYESEHTAREMIRNSLDGLYRDLPFSTLENGFEVPSFVLLKKESVITPKVEVCSTIEV